MYKLYLPYFLNTDPMLPVCRIPLCVPNFKAPVFVSTCLKIVPSPKNRGLLASTTIVSK